MNTKFREQGFVRTPSKRALQIVQIRPVVSLLQLVAKYWKYDIHNLCYQYHETAGLFLICKNSTWRRLPCLDSRMEPIMTRRAYLMQVPTQGLPTFLLQQLAVGCYWYSCTVYTHPVFWRLTAWSPVKMGHIAYSALNKPKMLNMQNVYKCICTLEILFWSEPNHDVWNVAWNGNDLSEGLFSFRTC